MGQKGKKDVKKELEIRLANILKGQINYTVDNTDLTNTEKIEQADIILNVMRFLTHYEENVKVLDEYWRNKNKSEKPKNDNIFDEVFDRR